MKLRCLLMWTLHWRQLLITSLLYRVLSFVVLTPLVSGLLQLLISLSGKSALTDLDIVMFVVSPLGLLGSIVVAAVWLAIAALEQSALLGVLACRQPGPQSVSAGWSLALSRCRPLLQVTLRLTVATVLAAAPFLLVAGLTYNGLLREHDINYYLKEKPPEFLTAVGIGVLLAVLLVGICLRLWSGWLVSLPLTVLEQVPGSQALRESSRRTAGQRSRLVGWLLLWIGGLALISTILTLVGGWAGRWLLPTTSDSLGWLVLAAGLIVLVWSIAHLALNLVGASTLATLLFAAHKGLGGDVITPDAALAADSGGQWRMSARRVSIAIGIGLVVALGIGWATLRSVPTQDQVAVMAHRGASSLSPENTLAAIDAAIEAGADWVEIDVQETADGEVVVFHDSDFMKTANNPLKLWEATAGDLEQIDIGSWFGDEFADQRVPTLSQVFERCHNRIGVNIELKYYGHDQDLENKVAQLVEQHDMTDQVLVMSLKAEGVAKMKALRPDWKVGLLMSVSAGGKQPKDVDFLAVNAGFVSPTLIRRSHREGQEVYAWTVNDALTMSNLIGRGVDGLLTDRPALARSVLEQRAEMSPAQRLLLELAMALGGQPPVADQ